MALCGMTQPCRSDATPAKVIRQWSSPVRRAAVLLSVRCSVTSHDTRFTGVVSARPKRSSRLVGTSRECGGTAGQPSGGTLGGATAALSSISGGQAGSRTSLTPADLPTGAYNPDTMRVGPSPPPRRPANPAFTRTAHTRPLKAQSWYRGKAASLPIRSEIDGATRRTIMGHIDESTLSASQ
jgi:hypothetical protein